MKQGHEVTLFASSDSTTKAHLVSPQTSALRLREDCFLPEVYQMLQMEMLFEHPDKFDIMHFHTGLIHFPLVKYHQIPHVTTMHGRLNIPDLGPFFETFPTTPVVSISDAQRTPLPWLNWQGTVHHGIPKDLYTFREEPGDYLLFIGRISPEKRLDRAIDIACRSGLPLKVGAKVDRADRVYFEQEIAHLLDHPLVEFIGEVDEKQKNELMSRARAFLFPIDWPEPFGLVMIEAFACGTPVIAYPHGSVPEVMRDGVSGYVVDSIEGAVEAVKKAATFDRKQCRAYFESHFTVSAMCNAYLEVYERLVSGHASLSMVPFSSGNGRPAYPSRTI